MDIALVALVGAVIGGGMTLLGAILTLRYQRQADLRRSTEAQRIEAERNRIAAMPLFEYELSSDDADFDNSRGQLATEPAMAHINIRDAHFDDPGVMEWKYDLIVRNIGLGHAFVETIQFHVRTNTTDLGQVHDGGYVDMLVKVGCRRDLRFYFYAPELTDFTDPSDWGYMVDVTIGYTDLLGNKYSQLVHTSVSRALLSDSTNSAGWPTVQMFHPERPMIVYKSPTPSRRQ